MARSCSVFCCSHALSHILVNDFIFPNCYPKIWRVSWTKKTCTSGFHCHFTQVCGGLCDFSSSPWPPALDGSDQANALGPFVLGDHVIFLGIWECIKRDVTFRCLMQQQERLLRPLAITM